jgi:6-phosphogluconolactonase (cycloisomerase 2 family)
MVFSPNGKYAYFIYHYLDDSVNLGSTRIFQYYVDQSGNLTPMPNSYINILGYETYNPKIDPTGRFLYLSEGSNFNLHLLSIGGDGSLIYKDRLDEIGNVSSYTSTFSFTSDGRLAFISPQFSSNLIVYAIDASGKLTKVDRVINSVIFTPDKTNNFLYSINNTRNKLLIHRIKSDGALTFIKEIPISAAFVLPNGFINTNGFIKVN